MPRGDGTGPGGMGSMTGRGIGYCAGNNVPGFMNPPSGRGFGGRPGYWGGGGRGWRNRYYATGQPGWARYGFAPGIAQPSAYPVFGQPMSQEQEAEMLKNHAEALQRELDAINKRLDEVEKEQ